MTFTAEDDDGGQAVDEVDVIITGNAAARRSPGYWQHQSKGNGKTDFDQATLQCYLDIAGFMSTVFHEETDASTIPAAEQVLFGGTVGGDMVRILNRQLLTAWLNFANGSIGLDTMVDTDGDLVPDATFADVVVTAEPVRLDPGATTAELEAQKDILERINGSLA